MTPHVITTHDATHPTGFVWADDVADITVCADGGRWVVVAGRRDGLPPVRVSRTYETYEDVWNAVQVVLLPALQATRYPPDDTPVLEVTSPAQDVAAGPSA